MLKNNLFNIISENCIDSKLEYLITINSGHPIYKGHFPGIPVTPGVVEHEIVQELFEHHIGFKTKLLKISNSKFKYILSPVSVDELQVVINYIINGNEVKIASEISDSKHKYLILKATYSILF